MTLKKWLYRGGRPNWLASIVNKFWALVHSLGVAPDYLVTLEISGRQSHSTIRLPVVMVKLQGERYLVSMLGAGANWVHNVKAANGDATLHHGRREEVHLEEIPADRRANILKKYLKIAPGAREHIPVDKDAPLSDFERIAAQFPVYHVEPRNSGQ